MISDSARTRILQMIRKGWCTELIRREFHGNYTTQQIAAVRAWVTMGKYGRSRSSLRNGKAKKNGKVIPLSDSDRITILRALSKGKSVKEVVIIMKKRYTTQQIAAVQAWKTMGKYQ